MAGRSHVSVSSFKGNLLERREVRDFLLYDLHYGPNLHVPTHRHARAYLGCVVEGSFKTRFSGHEERTYNEGAVLFHPRGESHANRFSGGRNRILCVEFTEAISNRLSLTGLDFSRRAQRSQGPAVFLGRRLFMQFRQQHAASVLAMEGLILELVAELLHGEAGESSARRSPLADTAAELIQKDFTGEVSLNSVASVLGVRPDHLAKRFRRAHGCTVGEYVRRLRIEAACAALISTTMSIAEVALYCGYSDQSHLSHAFQQRFGVSPTAFRRAHRR